VSDVASYGIGESEQRRTGAVGTVPPLGRNGGAAASAMVLLIDDDGGYRGALSAYLHGNGVDVREFDGFAAALAWFGSAVWPAVVVTDLTVGSRHLFDCLSPFHRPDAAVLVLSDQDNLTDTIVALELGADDVIAKSVDRREILARIRAAIRRLRTSSSDAAQSVRPGPAAGSAAWRFLPEQRRLLDPNDACIHLTGAEAKLLAAFTANAGKTLTRRYLSVLVLERPGGAGDRGIDNLVLKLRRKLGGSARQSTTIQTARPIGYRFTGWPAA
jgi:DNA-binding response OmpR family regulator